MNPPTSSKDLYSVFRTSKTKNLVVPLINNTHLLPTTPLLLQPVAQQITTSGKMHVVGHSGDAIVMCCHLLQIHQVLGEWVGVFAGLGDNGTCAGVAGDKRAPGEFIGAITGGGEWFSLLSLRL